MASDHHTVETLKMSNRGCLGKSLTSPREGLAFAFGSWEVTSKLWECPM